MYSSPAFNVKKELNFDRVRKTYERKNIEALGHAGAVVRIEAQRLIHVSKHASPVGTPPHSRAGLLRRAIVYAIDNGSVFHGVFSFKANAYCVIGPRFSVINKIGGVHEWGMSFRGKIYPKRPFMSLALFKTAPRLSRFWSAAVSKI